MSRWLISRSYPSPRRGYGLPWMYSALQYNARRQGPLGSGAGPSRVSPYGSVAGSPAHLSILVLSSTTADYDGFAFLLDFPLATAPTATAQQGYTFDDDAAPPTTGSTIKIMGLTTTAQIAAQIVLAINLTATSRAGAFRAYVNPSNLSEIIVLSLPGGERANLAATVPDDFNDVLAFNGVTDYNAETAYFFGGTDFSIPARFGQNYGFLPSVANSPPVLPIIIT